ncbi:RrF2 family transcriptional regulator [Parapedobacter lycopersici]|uniref:RrF2 family transcriptional regulator n=1 Tax=Parapedobacter lycopersici TaxID=1864939 RepID=UPI00214DB0E8|nr:Rrf2 family transcriptional regulator [Parapedobacter lycopersici]
MFSKTCEYAIRAVIFIARESKDGRRVGVREIAQGIGSPVYFIAKILQELSKKGIIQSLKGPTGGFYMDGQSLDYTLADIVVAIDGDKLLTGCALGLNECSEKRPCPLHFEFRHIRKELHALLARTKLNELQDKFDASIFYLGSK